MELWSDNKYTKSQKTLKKETRITKTLNKTNVNTEQTQIFSMTYLSYAKK